MGLLGKLSEKRMKDPAPGTLRVVGISQPDPTATATNYRLDGVVSADGLLPTAITHKGMTSVSHWPAPGESLPVTVDRQNPEHIVIHWKEVPSGAAAAQSMAERLAEQMRTGNAAGVDMPVATTTTSVTVNGQPVNLGAGMTSDLASIVQSAINRASALPGASMAGMAGMAGMTVGAPAMPTVSNDDILARGTPGNATLLGTFPPPVPVVKEGRTGVGLMLNVMIDGRPPYPIQNVYAVPNDKVGKLVPGTMLPVRVDQTMANLVAIDWNAITP